MADEKNDKGDKTLEAIKETKPKQEHVMRTPGGNALRQDMANQRVLRDQERHSGNRAAKYAKVEKESIANKEHVREGTRGIASKEFNQQKPSNKEIER